MKNNHLKTAAKSIDKHIEKLLTRRNELEQKASDMAIEAHGIGELIEKLKENKKQLLIGEPEKELSLT